MCSSDLSRHMAGFRFIHISPASTQYINPMDINSNYSEEDNPLALKADFVLSLCELVVGGKEGLQPVEKTVIDRCVHRVDILGAGRADVDDLPMQTLHQWSVIGWVSGVTTAFPPKNRT